MRRLLLVALFTLLPTLASAQVNNPPSTFFDNLFQIRDNLDPTKRALFQLSGLSTGTARTFTLPDQDSTVAVLGAQAFGGMQTFDGGLRNINSTLGLLLGADVPLFFVNNTDSYGRIWIGGANSSLGILTGTLINNILIAEVQDRGFNFSHAVPADPTTFTQSHNQSTTEWGSTAHNATNFVINSGAGAIELARPLRTSAASPPTCASTGLGTGTCTLSTGSTDTSGDIVLTAGVGVAAVGVVTLTFAGGGAIGTNPPTCVYSLTDGSAAWAVAATIKGLSPITVALATSTWVNSVTPLTNTATYQVSYICIAK